MARIVVATDNFNRADGGPGSDWLRLTPATGGDMNIVSNQIGGTDAASGNLRPASRWNGAGTFTDDQYASIEVSALSFQGANFFIGVIVRASADLDANRDFYAAFVSSDSSGPNYLVSLIKVVNGTTTVLHSASVAWSVNQRIELEAVGTTLTTMKDGVALGGSFTQTDASLTTGKPGITGTNAVCPGDNVELGNLGTPTFTQVVGSTVGPGMAQAGNSGGLVSRSVLRSRRLWSRSVGGLLVPKLELERAGRFA